MHELAGQPLETGRDLLDVDTDPPVRGARRGRADESALVRERAVGDDARRWSLREDEARPTAGILEDRAVEHRRDPALPQRHELETDAGAEPFPATHRMAKLRVLRLLRRGEDEGGGHVEIAEPADLEQ